MNNSERINAMHERLTAALHPNFLEIIDDSYKHVGHAGAATGMGYFTVKINSPQFSGLSLIQKHRLVYAALGSMMATDIHALQIILTLE